MSTQEMQPGRHEINLNMNDQSNKDWSCQSEATAGTSRSGLTAGHFSPKDLPKKIQRDR